MINDIEKVEDQSSELFQKDKLISAEMSNVEALISTKLDKKERTKAKFNDLKKLVSDSGVELSKKMAIIQDDIRKKEFHKCKIVEEKQQIEELTLLYGKEHEEAIKVMSENFHALRSKVKEYNNRIFDAYQ